MTKLSHATYLFLVSALFAISVSAFSLPKPWPRTSQGAISIRVANALPNVGTVDIAVNGDTQWKAIKYTMVGTDVYLDPGTYTFEVFSSDNNILLATTNIIVMVPTTIALTETYSGDVDVVPYADYPNVKPSRKSAAVQLYDLVYRDCSGDGSDGVQLMEPMVQQGLWSRTPAAKRRVTADVDWVNVQQCYEGLDTVETKKGNTLFTDTAFLDQTTYVTTDPGFQDISFSETDSGDVLLTGTPIFTRNSYFSLFLFGDLSSSSSKLDPNVVLTTINDNKHISTYDPGNDG